MTPTEAKKRILVWSDFPYMTRTVSASLSDDYDVVGIGFDDDCVRNIGKLLPQLIVLDVRSGDRDVVSLCRSLQQNPSTRRIQILLLQGAFDDAPGEAFSDMDFGDSLVKPFLSYMLKEKVDALIKSAPDMEEALDEKRPVQEPVTITDEELDEALAEALRELREESVEVKPEGLSFPATSEAELSGPGNRESREGVGREEAAELLDKGLQEGPQEVKGGEEQLETKEMAELAETNKPDTIDDRAFLDEMIDGIVDTAMERVSIELKASLKKTLDDKMRQMARRAIQDLMPKLSERLIAEMFSTKTEKQ
ncbi:MAG: hypothetical protein JW941_07630 [Candidatus Coatesbacteria bacterium]|nr:hypothetical protein [Candidatus Coatesbacteria bacterium]